MDIRWVAPPTLAAGSIPITVKDLRKLKAQNIQVIVTLTEHPLTAQTGITAAILEELGFICYHAPIIDYQPPEKSLALKTARFISDMQAEGKPVYLHCYAGEGRTGTMLHVLYLTAGLTLDEAKARVRDGKPSSDFSLLSDTQQAFLESLAAEFSSH